VEELQFFEQFLALSIARNSFLTPLLERAVFRFKLKLFVKDAITRFAPGALNNYLSNRRPEADRLVDISVHPRYSDSHVLSLVKERLAANTPCDSSETVGSVYAIPDAIPDAKSPQN